MAGVLPPLGDGPRGSPVWCSFLFVGVCRPPSSNRPSGSRQGVTPCTPYCALWARGRSRESKLAAELPPLGDGPRGSRAWCVFLFVGVCRLPSDDRPSGSLQRPAECRNTIDFLPCKISHATSNYPNSHYLTFAPPKRRRSRAAIGSGGKKPCPF